MIIYFSGTGNSEFVANEMGRLLHEPVKALTAASPTTIKFEGDTLGFIFPIYSWGVPPILLNYVRSLNQKFLSAVRRRKIWMIGVCGDEVAFAPEMLKCELANVGLKLAGGWSVQMPNNYVLLPGFDVDSAKVEREKLDAAPAAIEAIASKIRSGEWEESYVRGGNAWLKSRIIYPLFKRWGIFPARWGATDACVSCGKCERACPMKNISVRPGEKPRWGDNCTSCLGCYHICPRHAVAYGRITRHKGQYLNPHKH